MRCYMGDLLFMLWPLFRSRVSGPPVLHYDHWTIPTRNALVGCQPRHKELWGTATIFPGHPRDGKMGLEGSIPAQTDRPIARNTFYPYSSQGTRHDSWIYYSWVKPWKKQKRTLNTPVSPWELSDTYSGLQMSAILMNTPKIKFLGVRFSRTALKSQPSLVGAT